MSIFKKRNQSNPIKDILIRENTGTIKPFSYNKNSTHLGFQLNIESKKELNDFKEILEAAIEDVDKYIKKL
jgi:hypothetical protein